jgi:hypothetical protein
MRRVLLMLALSLMLLTSYATVALADTWYHPNSGDYWDCSYYEDGRYWCYGYGWGTWFQAAGPDSMTRNGWWAV